MKKTVVSLFLTVCLLCMNISALADVTPKGSFPVTDESITLRVAVPANAKVADINTNAYTLYLEEQTGINLEIIPLSSKDTDMATQVNSMMLSGDLPDIFIGYDFGYDELSAYAEAGYVLALDEYIAEYGDEYYKFLDAVKNLANAEAHVTVDGHVYAVPSLNSLVTNLYAAYKIRIPQIFLDNLNMEMPTTLDEFYQYLVAVRDQDANGNGDPSDEIPMSGCDGSYFLIENIGSAFQYTDGQTFLKVNNGKIEFIGANEQFKQTVEFLKKLVDEKLLDPAFYTQDRAMLLTQNTQEYPLIGADASYYSSNYDSSSALYASLTIIPNLVGPDGYYATHFDAPAVRRSMVITTACKEPAAAYRLCDFILNEYAGVVARLGIENVHWQYVAADSGKIGRDGDTALYQLIGPQEWTLPVQNSIWRLDNFFYADALNHVAEDPNGSVGKLAKDIYKWKLAEQETGEQLPQLLMDSETSIEYNEVQKMVVDYVNENVAKFVLGDRSMDEWNDYIATLNSIGVDYYVQLAQDAYDAMK